MGSAQAGEAMDVDDPAVRLSARLRASVASREEMQASE